MTISSFSRICGKVNYTEYRTSLTDSVGEAMLKFNSKFSKDKAPSTGFIVLVEATNGNIVLYDKCGSAISIIFKYLYKDFNIKNHLYVFLVGHSWLIDLTCNKFEI